MTGLHKRYGAEEVVASIDLELKPGECYAVPGYYVALVLMRRRLLR